MQKFRSLIDKCMLASVMFLIAGLLYSNLGECSKLELQRDLANLIGTCLSYDRCPNCDNSYFWGKEVYFPQERNTLDFFNSPFMMPLPRKDWLKRGGMRGVL